MRQQKATMKKRRARRRAVIFSFGAAAALAAVLAADWHWRAVDDSVAERWYSIAQARAGEEVYAANCISCHGAQGVGAANWQQRGADGAFPPPPLNGSAHTWHHSLSALQRTIKNGGAAMGGNMPAFGDALSDEEIEAVLAYIQSQWRDEIYQVWKNKVNKRADN